MALSIRPYGAADVDWAEELIGAQLGGRIQARLGSTIDALTCDGLVAEADDGRVGIVTYVRDGDDVEVVYLEAVHHGSGVGTALLEAVAETTGADRMWMVTTNDNLDALRFYQRRGFRICDVRVGGADDARRTLKPTIPAVGNFSIPIRDEIVLERRIDR